MMPFNRRAFITNLPGVALGGLAATVVLGIPALHYRATYEQHRRLRVVTEGKFYRSGQLTAEGFREAHRRYKFKSVINLQEEALDPLIPVSFTGKAKILQSEVLSQLGVKYFALDGGVLDLPKGMPVEARPPIIDEYLEILDNPDNYPVLIHCKAGLHRTGLMVAMYRMEYENKSVGEVMEELKANGFGTFAATSGNAYVKKFILEFEPHSKRWPHGKPVVEGK